MADTTERIILSIEIPKPEGEKQVDALTRKITDLQTATVNLKKQNNELIKQGKQNSEEYIENTRQIEINRQKINEATASRKGLVQTLIAEDNSIKSLKVRNAELIKQRDLFSTKTEEGRKKIAEINAELDKNNDIIKENVSAQEKQRLGVGGYTDALDKLVPGLGATANGIQATTKAALAFIATPLGLVIGTIGLALAALIQYFKGSEEGQDRLNRIMQVGSAIMGKVMDIVRDLGEAIYNAFTNPKQALQDFGDLIRQQIQNRIEGMLELLPALGRAIKLAFSGEFAAAGKVAVDAVAKVGLGVENITDKTTNLINSISDLADTAIKEGNKVAELQKQIREAERKLQIDSANTALAVAKLKEKAVTQEGEARIKTIEQAIALEQKLANQGVKLAEQRFELAKVEDAIADNTIEDNNKLIEAEANLINARRAHFDTTLKLQKQLQSAKEEEIRLNEAAAKRQDELLKEANKMLDAAEKLELERQQRIRDALNETEQLRLEQAVINAEGLEQRIEREIELETFKAFTLLENEKLIDEERQLVIEKSQANINNIIVKGTKERVAKEAAEEKKLAELKKRERDAEIAGKFAVANASVGLLREVFGESKAFALAQVGINTAQAIVNALAMSGPPWVGIAMSIIVGALGAAQSLKIAGIKFAKGGMLMLEKFAYGGMPRNVSRFGGMLRGPSHARGGIPFTVGGRPGFEAEGGEAIINRRSTQMFRPVLSAINQAGGGVAFSGGGLTKYQTGGAVGATQTRQAFQAAESRSAIRDTVRSVMENMPPTIVTVEDINARTSEYSEQANKAQVA